MTTGNTVRKVCISAAGVAMSALLLAGWTSAHDEKWTAPPEAKKLRNPVASTADNLNAARAIFMDKCASCHGDKGLGDGPEAAMYDVQPSNLADAHMMSEMTDGEIFWKIGEGNKPMPSFKKQLSDEQRWQLVNYIRTLSPKPAGRGGAAQHQ